MYSKYNLKIFNNEKYENLLLISIKLKKNWVILKIMMNFKKKEKELGIFYINKTFLKVNNIMMNNE